MAPLGRASRSSRVFPGGMAALTKAPDTFVSSDRGPISSDHVKILSFFGFLLEWVSSPLEKKLVMTLFAD